MTGTDVISQQYGLLVDKVMCSYQCPCYEDDKQFWTLLGDDFLRKHYRAFNLTSDEIIASLDPNKNQTLETVIPMIFSDDPDNTFASYQDCYEEQVIGIENQIS